MTVSQNIIDTWIYPKVCPICSSDFPIPINNRFKELNIRCSNGDFSINYFDIIIDVYKKLKDYKLMFIFNVKDTVIDFAEYRLYKNKSFKPIYKSRQYLNFINKSQQETIEKIEKILLLK